MVIMYKVLNLNVADDVIKDLAESVAIGLNHPNLERVRSTRHEKVLKING